MGISKNSNQLTTNILSITAANCMTMTTIAGGAEKTCFYVGTFAVGDVVRAHTAGTTNGSGTNNSGFIICRVV
jgi:hypothetical protein